jgi:hypothetical protein
MILFSLYDKEYYCKHNRHHFSHNNGNPNTINFPNHWEKQNSADLEHQCTQEGNQSGG